MPPLRLIASLQSVASGAIFPFENDMLRVKQDEHESPHLAASDATTKPLPQLNARFGSLYPPTVLCSIVCHRDPA
jgi:hypothetical protein